MECNYCGKKKQKWYVCNVCHEILKVINKKKGARKMDFEEEKEKFKEYLEKQK